MYQIRYFLENYFFSIWNQKSSKEWKSFETEKFRNRNVNLWYIEWCLDTSYLIDEFQRSRQIPSARVAAEGITWFETSKGEYDLCFALLHDSCKVQGSIKYFRYYLVLRWLPFDAALDRQRLIFCFPESEGEVENHMGWGSQAME